MRVIVGFEASGVVRDAFLDRGHDAISLDILSSRSPRGLHIQDDIQKAVIDWASFDLAIMHPPCTYLCSMGIWWNHKRPERWPLTYEAQALVEWCWALPVPRMAIENPIGYLGTHWQPSTQRIHPWQFGHEASKPTCLWLRNLPPLAPTNIVGKGEFYTKKNGARAAKWSHLMSGTRKEERARIAATTFPGIGFAMADQWGSLSTEV